MALSFLPLALSTLAPGLLPQEPEIDLRWQLPARPVFAGEVLPLAVRIEVPEGFLGGKLVQLFARPLDLPLQVDAFGALPDALVEIQEPEGFRSRSSLTVALDGEIGSARGPVGAEDPAAFEVLRWYHARRASTQALPAPRARYTLASDFREDFVQGRVPVDPAPMDVIGEPAVLEIRNLPEAGRPLEFRGLVGHFENPTVEVPVVTGHLGQPITYTVYLKSSAPPPPNLPELVGLDPLDGFAESAGRSVITEPGRVGVRFTVTPKSLSVTELPSMSAAFFDPTVSGGTFRTITAKGRRFVVLPGKSAQAARGDDPPAPPRERPTPYWTYGVLSFVFLLAVASVIRRHSARTPSDLPRDPNP